MNALTTKALMLHSRAITLPGRARAKGRERIRKLREDGQGTVEYAILVGVLAVIAIVAIVAFKDKLNNLWYGIQAGINNENLVSPEVGSGLSQKGSK